MNFNATIKKLQTAILQTGLVISINRSQFYSADQKRFIPIITLSTPVFHYFERQGIWKDQNYEIIRTSSQGKLYKTIQDNLLIQEHYIANI